MGRKFIDMTGKRFGSWLVVSKYNAKYWFCRCDCGTTGIVGANNLRSGRTQACKTCGRSKPRNLKHGLSHHPAYKVWTALKYRVESPASRDYKYYGGRGIKICDDWQDPKNFVEWALANGYQPPTGKRNIVCTIDRINNDGDYTPENCRWTDMFTQIPNRHVKHNNVPFTHNCETKLLIDWAKYYNINYLTVVYRINVKGMDTLTALSTPARHRKKVIRRTKEQVHG